MTQTVNREQAPNPIGHTGPTTLVADGVSHVFGEKRVLDRVTLTIQEGEIHALLGPNGAGKTTLIRILAGLLLPTEGAVDVLGFSPAANARRFRQQIGYVPSGDRTFYLRISGLENLVFFARLYGLSRRDAVRAARAAMADVGIEAAAKQRVAEYSHGMQKRLSLARALLPSPRLLLVDEATHDLDPIGGRRVRDLVAGAAAERGVSVVWATQRLDEIRGFAHSVTVLDGGVVRFRGTVPELMAQAVPRRFVLHLGRSNANVDGLQGALRGLATLAPVGNDPSHFLIFLSDGVVLGHALAALVAAGVDVLSCREERSEIEEAFVLLTHGSGE